MHYDITPMAKPRMTRRDKFDTRPIVQKYWAFKADCQLKRVEIPQPCKIIFWVPMPPSWSKKKRVELLYAPHTQTPDLDNYLKGIMDAVFQDDKHIWSVHAIKRWAEKGGITITRLLIREIKR